MRNFLLTSLTAVVVVSYSSVCHAQAILFQDQMTDPNGWGVNRGPEIDSAATFGYDYSADGIPEAPNTKGGDTATSGVKLEANLDIFATSTFFTIYPTGQNFTGDYVLEFDMWMNYSTVDREDNGGAGTTEFGGGGIGYDGVTADIASGAQAMVTGEGGSGNDYRAFKSPPQFFIQDAEMVAGTHNATGSTNYTDFFPAGSGVPPAIQNQLPADPNTNQNRAGSPGFQWFTWRISTVGNRVRTEMVKPNGESLDIVSYDKTDTSDGSSGVSTDGNISIFYADFFDSISANPQLTFGIADNVVVSEAISGDFDFDGDVDGDDFLKWQRGSGTIYNTDDLTAWQNNYGFVAPLAALNAVPEPASIAILALGAATLITLRRRS